MDFFRKLFGKEEKEKKVRRTVLPLQSGHLSDKVDVSIKPVRIPEYVRDGFASGMTYWKATEDYEVGVVNGEWMRSFGLPQGSLVLYSKYEKHKDSPFYIGKFVVVDVDMRDYQKANIFIDTTNVPTNRIVRKCIGFLDVSDKDRRHLDERLEEVITEMAVFHSEYQKIKFDWEHIKTTMTNMIQMTPKTERYVVCLNAEYQNCGLFESRHNVEVYPVNDIYGYISDILK